jgi:hypothetical protein
VPPVRIVFQNDEDCGFFSTTRGGSLKLGGEGRRGGYVMKRIAFLLLVSAAFAPVSGEDQKLALSTRIVDELFSLGPDADIPGEYAFLYWPALKELSRPENRRRLELVRDVSMVGTLFKVWPSRSSLVAAVYENIPNVLLQEYEAIALGPVPPVRACGCAGVPRRAR